MRVVECVYFCVFVCACVCTYVSWANIQSSSGLVRGTLPWSKQHRIQLTATYCVTHYPNGNDTVLNRVHAGNTQTSSCSAVKTLQRRRTEEILCVLHILGVREITVKARVIRSEVRSCFIENPFIYSLTEQREVFSRLWKATKNRFFPLVMQMQVFGSASQQHANKLKLNAEKWSKNSTTLWVYITKHIPS